MEKETIQNNKSHRRVLEGTVVSDKMKDTVVVVVERFVKHPAVGKYLNNRKRYKAHDPGNTKKIGDKVKIEECAPISKQKSFKII
jgi:small subunit ribosomal protein S17